MYFLLFGFCYAIISMAIFGKLNGKYKDEVCKTSTESPDVIIANIEYDKINKTNSCCLLCSKIYIIQDKLSCYCSFIVDTVGFNCIQNNTNP